MTSKILLTVLILLVGWNISQLDDSHRAMKVLESNQVVLSQALHQSCVQNAQLQASIKTRGFGKAWDGIKEVSSDVWNWTSNKVTEVVR